MAVILALALGGDAAEGLELLELELELELLAMLGAFALALGVVAPACGDTMGVAAPPCGAAGRTGMTTVSSAFSSAGLSSGPAATAGTGFNTIRF
jgi:hypothetical protein